MCTEIKEWVAVAGNIGTVLTALAAIKALGDSRVSADAARAAIRATEESRKEHDQALKDQARQRSREELEALFDLFFEDNAKLTTCLLRARQEGFTYLELMHMLGQAAIARSAIPGSGIDRRNVYFIARDRIALNLRVDLSAFDPPRDSAT